MTKCKFIKFKLLAEDTILINIIVDLFGRNKEILEYIVKHLSMNQFIAIPNIFVFHCIIHMKKLKNIQKNI